MKNLFVLFFSLLSITLFGQDEERQKISAYASFIFISESGDTISTPLKAVGELISVTKEGDTLEHVDLNDKSIGEDIIWSSSKISKELESIWMQFYQNDNRILLAANERQILLNKINKLDSLLKLVTTSSVDTVYVIPNPVDSVNPVNPIDTTVVNPVVDCDNPLNELRFLLMDVNTGDTLRTLKQTDTINKAEGKFSIIVVSCDNSAIKGVTFFLDGVQLRREGIEPYAINGDNGSNYNFWNPPVGTYELKSEVESKTWSQPNRIFSITLTIIDGIGGTTPTNPTNPTTPVIGGQFCEVNGLVVIEAESLNINNTGWAVRNTEANYSGSGYLTYEGSRDHFNNTGQDVITAKINITNPGVYEFKWRNQAGKVHTTEENDTWLRFPDADNFYALKNGSQLFKPVPDCNSDPKANCPKGASNNGWFKVYVNSLNWQWFAGTSDNGPATEIFARFDKPGIYTMEISARSRHHFIDKIVMYDNNLTGESAALNIKNKEVRCLGGETGSTDSSTSPNIPTPPQVGGIPNGRIALIHDGNRSDADDHGAMAMMFMQAYYAGIVDKITFCGYNALMWDNPRCEKKYLTNGNGTYSDWCDIMNDAKTFVVNNMEVSNSIFYDLASLEEAGRFSEATNALVAEMNKSTAANPLWILNASPSKIYGDALKLANPSALNYVNFISHSSWNETSNAGGGKSYNNALSGHKGLDIRIADQNTSCNNTPSCGGRDDFADEGTSWDKPEPTTTSTWDWMYLSKGGNTITDWVRKSNNNEFFRYEKSKIVDWSDAGMMWYLLSGGNVGGDEYPTWQKVKSLVENGEMP